MKQIKLHKKFSALKGLTVRPYILRAGVFSAAIVMLVALGYVQFSGLEKIRLNGYTNLPDNESRINRNYFERELLGEDLLASSEGVSRDDVVAQGGELPAPDDEPNSNNSEETTCDPSAEYCESNLLVDGSFENPVCTLNNDNSVTGKGCDAMGGNPTFYQADRSILIPYESRAFFNPAFDKPEYGLQEVTGERQCSENLITHGNNSFKIFSRGGAPLDGGLCLPFRTSPGGIVSAGIEFAVTQASIQVDLADPTTIYPVSVHIGYTSSPMQNEFFVDSRPTFSDGNVTWMSSYDIQDSDYNQESGFASRYAYGFLEASGIPSFATGLCFKAVSADNAQGVDTFWDGAYATTSPGSCDVPSQIDDGIDRGCGGWACGNTTILSGQSHTATGPDKYLYKVPSSWNASQCDYLTETNGAPSEYGTLFAGLDINSCDRNYSINNQRNINPEFECGNTRNWTFGFAWTAGVKDFAMLAYLDCAISSVNNADIKGTKTNPFICDKLFDVYRNPINSPERFPDPDFWLRFMNTYPGVAVATQAEGTTSFFRVPLLGSAVATGTIQLNDIVDGIYIDPYLIGKRNYGEGAVNLGKFNLVDKIISQYQAYEAHYYSDESTIERNEILVGTDPLLANDPVCTDIQGEPITKFHYGAGNNSDRAIFGFGDDEGTAEHILDAKNFELTPEQLCDSDHYSNPIKRIYGEVVGSECTIREIEYDVSPTCGTDKREISVTFTDENLSESLDFAGILNECSVPVPTVIPSPVPTIVYGSKQVCEKATICGRNLTCKSTLQELYDACSDQGGEFIDEVGGNPFIRWERPEGWDKLTIVGLNGLLKNAWHIEYNSYPYPIRHENVGIDINQVVSLYDQQIPKCSWVPDAAYCTDDSAVNKGKQVCRRVPPYNCNCTSSNYATCFAECEGQYRPPPSLDNVGLSSEEIREIIDNDQISPWEQYVSILEPNTRTDLVSQPYIEGEEIIYDPTYTGQYILANTSEENFDQCSADSGTKTGVSQVRIENYYAYVGQIPRMNERTGFAASNNNDEKSLRQLEIDLDSANVSDLIRFITRAGEAYEYIALPYCDLLTPNQISACQESSEESCDCQIRSCNQIYSDKLKLIEKYVPELCNKLRATGANEWQDYDNCMKQNTLNQKNLAIQSLNECLVKDKIPENFNCDPMANYLISQGFDSPQLQFAKCDYIPGTSTTDSQCIYEKYGVHLITGPTQQDKYERAENLGLKWKMEVITKNSSVMVSAMIQSINSFSGNTVFRFCNADKTDLTTGNKIQDPSCDFRTDLTGSSKASGELVADILIQVANQVSKDFYVSPVNEPISEHWAGGDPNVPEGPGSTNNTMAEVSEFYDGLIDRIESDANARAKIKIGGPTFNAFAFGNYENFRKFYNDFTPKNRIDYWTINTYNITASNASIEADITEAKNVFTDGKPIALNEIGDYDKDLDRLKNSISNISSDSRILYALLFNAFGGWDNPRGNNLVLNDQQIEYILESACTNIGPGACIPGGILGLYKAAAEGINSVSPRIIPEIVYAIGKNEGITSKVNGDPNQLAQTTPTLLNDYNGDGKIENPCTIAYASKEQAWNEGNCEYDVRGIQQFQNFTFYEYITNPGTEPLMRACIERLNVDTTVGRTGDAGLKAMFDANGGSYESNIYSRLRVGDNICAASLFISDIGRRINNNQFLTPSEWETEALAYTSGDNDNLIYQTAIKYLFGPFSSTTDCGPYSYCDNVALETKQLIESGAFDNIDFSCEPVTGYQGTCREIFAQVKNEPQHLPPPPSYELIQSLEYSDEVRPELEEWYQILVANNSYGCDMSWSVSENKVYCLNMESRCASCPVRVTATFRHEFNHLVGPYRSSGIIPNEFSADAVSNNGGWYQFKYNGEWKFATEILTDVSSRYGVSEAEIISFLQGRGPDPGIPFSTLLTDICHWTEQPRGVIQCPNRRVPPGLEAENCQNTGTLYNFPRNECGLGDAAASNIPVTDIQKYEKILVSLESAIKNCNDTNYYRQIGIDNPYPYIKYCPLNPNFSIETQCRPDMATNRWPGTTSFGPLDIIMLSPKFIQTTSKYYSIINQMGNLWATTTEEGYTLSDGTVLTYPNTILINFDQIPNSTSTEELSRLWLKQFAHIEQGWTTYRSTNNFLYRYHVDQNTKEHTTTGRFFEACADEAPNTSNRYKARERMCALRQRASEKGASSLIEPACRGNIDRLDSLIREVNDGENYFGDLFVDYNSSYGSSVTIPDECGSLTPSPQGSTQIGISVKGNPIYAYTFGDGPNNILFVGGMHGGYEYNSILLAYEAIDYFTENPSQVPEGATVHIVPAHNIDGQEGLVGTTGKFSFSDVPNISRDPDMCEYRYNENVVDLNRNWGCEWTQLPNPNQYRPCQGIPMTHGTRVFSEPETKALRDYIFKISPKAVVSWHSVVSNGAIYLAGCGESIDPGSRELGNTYKSAIPIPSNYNISNSIGYATPGDFTNWLDTEGIPGITVEISRINTIDWSQNRAGMMAVVDKYGRSP